MITETQQSTPNTQSAAPAQNAVPTLDAIAEKVAAMKRNHQSQQQGIETGDGAEAKAQSPVADEASDNDTSSVEPEVDPLEADNTAEVSNQDTPEEKQVSADDSTREEIIDFIEFANDNPNAKFKFVRNGKEMVIDAKKAAAILGQGGAIHEEARELKIQKAEFEEYLKEKRAQTEGLALAMEFTIRPELQQAYDEILKTQNYNTTFNQQLAQARQRGDQAAVSRIQASMAQNERWIQQQAQKIQQLKPRVDQFYEARRQQVTEILENNRRSFQDKELKNEYVYNEIRDKVSKNWAAAKNQLVPGVDNIDLISSDEHILSLIRDGLKYREKPQTKSAGSSIAALTQKKGGTLGKTQQDVDFQRLQEAAKKGDKKAQDNLLVAKLNALRSRR